ncbi:MAG: FimV/HubP family polar landmark protein [Burkholderiaceae bacterium]
MRKAAPKSNKNQRNVVGAWLLSVLALASLMLALVATPALADDGELTLDPSGTGYTMRLGAAERVALGAAGAVYQIPIDEPADSKRDAPAVAKTLRIVPEVPEGAARVDVITRRDGQRVVQLVLSGPALNAREVMMALYWHDGTFRRTYDLGSVQGAADEVRDPRLSSAAESSPVLAPRAIEQQVDAGAAKEQSPALPQPRAGMADSGSSKSAQVGASSTERPGPGIAVDSPVSEGVAAQAPARVEPVAATPRSGEREIVVRRGDSLWTIAENLDLPGLTQHQKMMGIYDANRSAFAGNVDTLRSGARLNLPATETLSRLAPEQALRAFLANSRVVPTASAEARPDAAARTSVAASTGRSGDQLEVGVDERDPAAARERDTAYNMAMAEAQSRIDDLTRQVEQLETLIQLKEIQIADARERLQAAGVDRATAGGNAAPALAQPGLPVVTTERDSGGSSGVMMPRVGVAGPAGAVAGATAAPAGEAAAGAGGGSAVQMAVDAARRAAEGVQSGKPDDGAGGLGVNAQPPAAAEGSPLLGGFQLPEGFWTFAAGILIALVIVMIVLRLRRRRAGQQDEEFEDDDDFLFDESTEMGPNSDPEMFGDSELGEVTGRPTQSPRTTTA